MILDKVLKAHDDKAKLEAKQFTEKLIKIRKSLDTKVKRGKITAYSDLDVKELFQEWLLKAYDGPKRKGSSDDHLKTIEPDTVVSLRPVFDKKARKKQMRDWLSQQVKKRARAQAAEEVAALKRRNATLQKENKELEEENKDLKEDLRINERARELLLERSDGMKSKIARLEEYIYGNTDSD